MSVRMQRLLWHRSASWRRTRFCTSVGCKCCLCPRHLQRATCRNAALRQSQTCPCVVQGRNRVSGRCMWHTPTHMRTWDAWYPCSESRCIFFFESARNFPERAQSGIGEKMPQHDDLSRHMTGDPRGVRVLGDLRRYRRVPAWRLLDSSVD